MQAFAVIPPVIVFEDSIIIEFIDETEPIDCRKYRLFLEKQKVEVSKIIVFRPTLQLWQDITSMVSPYYLTSLKTMLLDQVDAYHNEEGAIS